MVASGEASCVIHVALIFALDASLVTGYETVMTVQPVHDSQS